MQETRHDRGAGQLVSGRGRRVTATDDKESAPYAGRYRRRAAHVCALAQGRQEEGEQLYVKRGASVARPMLKKRC